MASKELQTTPEVLESSSACQELFASAASSDDHSELNPSLGLNINATNDDALRLILMELPLQEQIRLRIICRRWKLIIEQICVGKQSLKLFNGRKALYEYLEKAKDLFSTEAEMQLKPPGQFNDDLILNPRKLSSDIANETKNNQRNLDSHFLIDLFPAITSLVISVKEGFYENITNGYTKYDFTYLISQWPNLTTLVFTNFPAAKIGIDFNTNVPDTFGKINCYDYSPDLAKLERSYWTAFSEMSTLKSLTILHLVDKRPQNRPCKTFQLQDIPFPAVELVLSRLEQFTYRNYGFCNIYFLTHLKNCSKLKMNLDCGLQKPVAPQYATTKKEADFHAYRLKMHQQFEANIAANLAVKLTYLKTELSSFADLCFICDHFTELTVLVEKSVVCRSLLQDYLDFKSTVRQLVKLRKLTELHFGFTADDLLSSTHQRLPVLTSITTLYLNIDTDDYDIDDDDFVSSATLYHNLQHVFPCLEEVHIICRNESLRADARLYFVKTQFPALKGAFFYPIAKEMLPIAKEFRGQVAGFVKNLLNWP